MKIIFLDIDGVLNHEKFYRERHEAIKAGTYTIKHPYSEFDPVSIKYLNEIIEKTGAKIVLSSTWRFDDIDRLDDIFYHVGIIEPLYDVTPNLYDKYHTSLCRGKEINAWLEKHGDIDSYVILDDDNDIEENQLEHFIQTDAYADGLNEECMKKAIKILNK